MYVSVLFLSKQSSKMEKLELSSRAYIAQCVLCTHNMAVATMNMARVPYQYGDKT